MLVPTISETRPPIKITLEAKGGGERPDGCATELRCDAYLAAVGRQPMTENLNLKAVGVEVDEFGGLMVNGNLRSSVENIYGAGDVLGRPFLASTGVAQAMVCA
jgi:pyruvate/2-oxoglutarate dehydrogenase complex dihydrolipoamide dehydrogenase (E3) component